jgi:hypothetical protein
VQKFFGESFDVAEKIQEEKIGLRRSNSKNMQPDHVDVGKLNKFFGRHTHVERRKMGDGEDHFSDEGPSPRSDGSGADGEEGEEDDLEGGGDDGEHKKTKRDRKLRKLFGTAVDADKGAQNL